jgi:lipid-A-disaccharide synthase
MDQKHIRRVILFIAGDASGDLYAGRLASHFAKNHPHYVLHALGGEQLREAIRSTKGTFVGDTTRFRVISYTSIALHDALAKLLDVKLLEAKLRRFVRKTSLSAVVLCDWGAFNCRQLGFFKTMGVPVLYYFPPRSWQKRGRSGLDFARLVTRVATPFDWSAQRLAATGCHAEWVGHPVQEPLLGERSRESLRREFEVGPDNKLVALFPGSRISEIKVLGPRLAAAARILRLEIGATFLVPVAEHLIDVVRPLFNSHHFRILNGRSRDALRACDAAILKTGSCTLEAATLDAPAATVYDLNWIGRLEWDCLWSRENIPFIALPNIILDREVVPEFIGRKCRPREIATAVTKLLECPATRRQMLSDYAEVRRRIGTGQALSPTERTAQILLEMLGDPCSKLASTCSPPTAFAAPTAGCMDFDSTGSR